MTQTASSKKYAGQKVAFLLNGGGPTDSLTLGGKGAGLVKLTSLGIPVPAAFTISTSVARAYAQHGVTPRRLRHQMQWGIQALEKASGKRFGDPSDPLTVSVRSGASVSMAGAGLLPSPAMDERSARPQASRVRFAGLRPPLTPVPRQSPLRSSGRLHPKESLHESRS